VRAGIGYTAGEFDVQVGDPDLPSFKFKGGTLLGRLTIDTLDNVRFPRKGGLLSIEGDYVDDSVGAKESFAVTRSIGVLALSHGENTITANLRFGTSWRSDTDLGNFPIHRLGGLFRLSGLAPGEVAGPFALLGDLIAYRRIANPRFFTLKLPVYVGGSIEAGNAYEGLEEIDASSLIVAGSAFLGIDTPLGPLYVAYGLAEGGRSSGYLFLGQRF
jgi:NTE family protein